MMTNAYNELYLDDAMQNLGDMIDYAVCDLGFEPDEFFGWFISSGIASRFERGNPKAPLTVCGKYANNAIKYAKENNVPIIMDEGLAFLISFTILFTALLKSSLVSICGNALSIAITISNFSVKTSDSAQKSAFTKGICTLFFAALAFASAISPSLISDAVTSYPSNARPIACVPIPHAQSRILAVSPKLNF